jgi:hypothetical protein
LHPSYLKIPPEKISSKVHKVICPHYFPTNFPSPSTFPLMIYVLFSLITCLSLEVQLLFFPNFWKTQSKSPYISRELIQSQVQLEG